MKPFEESDKYNWPLTPDSIVIDAGGYEGNFAKHIHEKHGCTVHVLEPVTQFYLNILATVRHPKIHIHHFGIGGSSLLELFTIQGDTSGKYANNGRTDYVSIHEVHEVLSVFSRHGKVDLLKLNIEGMEFGVLEKLFQSAQIGLVKNLLIQFHNVLESSDMHRKAIQMRLKETHECIFNTEWVWEGWRLKC